MKLFCQHNYEILKEIIVPSELDNLRENGITEGTYYIGIARRQYIVYFKCSKCNKIKKDTAQTLEI